MKFSKFSISKLLSVMLFGLGFMSMGVVEDGGGGAGGSDETGDGGNTGETGGAKDDQTGEGDADKQKGGRKPTDEEAKLLKEVMQKKETLRRLEESEKAAREELKKFEGIDPVAIRNLLEQQRQAEEKQLEAKGEYERLKARMAEEHAKQTQTMQERLAALESQLASKDALVSELSVGTQFSQSQFIQNELTLTPAKARVVYGDHFDVVDGAVVAFDKPRGASNRTALVDQYGNNVKFDEALRKIVEADPDKDHLLKSKAKPGAQSGSKPKTDTRGNSNSGPKDAISLINQGLSDLKLI